MHYLSVKELIAINTIFMTQENQTVQLVFPEKLKFVVEVADTTLFDEPQYPTMASKAGILFIKIIKGHIFSDGNKRTAVATMSIFLNMNHYQLTFTQSELTEFAIQVAKTDNAQLDYQQIYTIIENHLAPLNK
ncbi:type II toxin-antitoxin system death-on-curing family toxin [Latilactobacillus fuchuensis]|nr:type II toxin-antitoxin system death-on-curing family toxin [Latilactobacillus fuchuensis]